jgi:hypothetical protein
MNRKPHQKYCSPFCAKKAWVKNNRQKQREISNRWKKKHPESTRKSSRKHKAKYPEQPKAQIIAFRKVSLGKCCERCGATENLERHHPDYSKPLEVQTLCKTCHTQVHQGLIVSQ